MMHTFAQISLLVCVWGGGGVGAMVSFIGFKQPVFTPVSQHYARR